MARAQVAPPDSFHAIHQSIGENSLALNGSVRSCHHRPLSLTRLPPTASFGDTTLLEHTVVQHFYRGNPYFSSTDEVQAEVGPQGLFYDDRLEPRLYPLRLRHLLLAGMITPSS